MKSQGFVETSLLSKKEILDTIEADLQSLAKGLGKLLEICKNMNPLHHQMAEQMVQATVVIQMGVDAMRNYERLVNEGGSRAEA